MTLGIFLPTLGPWCRSKLGSQELTIKKSGLNHIECFVVHMECIRPFEGSRYLDNYHIVVAWSTCASYIISIFGFSSSRTSVICFPNI